LVRKADGDPEGTNLVNANKGVIVEKGDAEPIYTKGCKRRMSDKENSDTWTCKKSKVSVQMR